MSKILIIEDDLPYRKVYLHKFEGSGFTVETAENGQEGLEKMHSFQPDIVLLDVMMPLMDGFQVLDRAKSDPVISKIPIVVMTNLSTDDDNQRLMQKGAEAVVVKSDVEPHDLVIKIQAILGVKK